MTGKKILYYTIGTELMPSSRARVYVYRKSLENSGLKVRIISAVSNGNCLARIRRTNRGLRKIVFSVDAALRLAFFIMSSFFYKTIVVQKILFPVKLLSLVKILFRGKRVLFDIDDVVFVSHQDDAEIRDAGKSVKFIENMKLYSGILTSTPHLNEMIAERFGIDRKSIVCVTDPVDTSVFHPDTGKEKDVIIGWIGTPSNTLYLEPCLRDLMKLADEGYSFRMLFCGADEKRVRSVIDSSIDCVFEKWSLEKEPSIYGGISIGLMPLPDDLWSRGKGGYKLMLYMASGKIAVAGAVGINNEIALDGETAFLVHPGESWYDKIKYILDNYDSMDVLRKKARNRIVDEYSLERKVPEYISVLGF